MGTIKLFDIKWQTKGAGPSPCSNLRTELYFAGCDRASNGNPCPDCCNSMLWRRTEAKALQTTEIFAEIERRQLPKYITFVGGEPTDQKEGLVELAQMLCTAGYHIILFTWHDLQWLRANFNEQELACFHMLVTGPYRKEECIYDPALDDGVHNAIGSGNQFVCVPKEQGFVCIPAASIKSLVLDEKQQLIMTYERSTYATTSSR